MSVIGHNFPNYRNIVVVGDKRFPARVLSESETHFVTSSGTFSKTTGRKLDDLDVRFEGPFTAEGDLEARL